ncbi:MAG: Crp/Fnr family transcriptional regulator [Muribaculaceae bacterium]|nr:Crp/Fnr family transcriptional regulator [Muribaculaceae bacterium]
MRSSFNEYKGRIDLSALIDGCREKGRLCHYAKGDVFVREGEVGRYFGVVESGYFKYTTITTEGNEAVVGFAFEGESVCDFNNSFQGIASEVSIMAGTNATVYRITFNEAKDIVRNRIDGSQGTLIAELFREIYHRHLELYRKSPTERYIELINHYPDIFNIVTIKEIASYLLVTPIYLSRIRKKLLKTGQK